MTSFVEKAVEVQLISTSPSRRLKLTGIYHLFNARLGSTDSTEEVQTHCQRFLEILDHLGKSAAVVGKSIAAQLSTLTGKIFMYI